MYPLHSYQSVPSTNSIARDLADKGAISGTAVIAANQTEGRGRLGKNWCSVAGKGLYCSIIVRPRLPVADYPKITLAAGLGVACAVDRLTGGLSQLKWPNDIFLDGKKCGGILTESSLHALEENCYAVIGIGLNIGMSLADLPEELHGKATSLLLETGTCPDVFHVFSIIREEVLQSLEVFSQKGFSPVIDAWRKRDFLLGKKMECVDSGGTVIVGVSLGPDDEGVLHVQDALGQIHTVLSGDIRLAGKTIRNR